MIRDLIKALEVDEFFGVSEYIDIAKGQNKYTTRVREMVRQAWREVKQKENGGKRDINN